MKKAVQTIGTLGLIAVLSTFATGCENDENVVVTFDSGASQSLLPGALHEPCTGEIIGEYDGKTDTYIFFEKSEVNGEEVPRSMAETISGTLLDLGWCAEGLPTNCVVDKDGARVEAEPIRPPILPKTRQVKMETPISWQMFLPEENGTGLLCVGGCLGETCREECIELTAFAGPAANGITKADLVWMVYRTDPPPSYPEDF